MMDNVLISSKPAELLNQKVREKIDSRLFLVCNYIPTDAVVFNWDAKFYLGIQNLYKFAIDTSCIIPSLNSYVPITQKGSFSDFRDSINKVRMLRSVIDHNNNEKNGYFEQEQLEQYTTWIREVLKKNQIESEDDFKKLYQELEKLGNKIVSDLNRFIDLVSSDPDRNRIVSEWEDNILRWYSKKQNIYLGQLANIYLANAAAEFGSIRMIPKNGIRRKLDIWIENMLFDDFDRNIERFEYLLKECDKKCPKAVDSIEIKLSVCKKEREDFQKKIESQSKRFMNSSRSLYREYFFMNLVEQLRETMKHYTGGMLPQELLQEDIIRNFKAGSEDFKRQN